MDPRFGPAWIAFAHTFALEGEHDHAVTAYSTCARMFMGFVHTSAQVEFFIDSIGVGLICRCSSLVWSK